MNEEGLKVDYSTTSTDRLISSVNGRYGPIMEGKLQLKIMYRFSFFL